MDLIRTKLSPPLDPSGLVDRPRLSARHHELASTRLVMVQAPAGFGKTSLLSQWYHSLSRAGCGVGWLTVDTVDREPVDLLAYLAAAVADAMPDGREPLTRLVNNVRDMTPDAMTAIIVNHLCRASAPVYLFLDDLHLLNAAGAAAFNRLTELAPETAHFIFALREAPDFALGRYRAQGQLLEIGVPELRFTAAETGSFMAGAGYGNLTQADLAELEERSEGWITGIKLASIALRKESLPRRVLASFNGSQRLVADFFAEEVLSAQSPAVRDFLLKTSVLDRLSPALCNAVAGSDYARQILDEIETSGLFLLQLDQARNWYRYHHLFGEFLQRKLADEHPGMAAQLLERACDWLVDNGHYVEAIEYALEADNPDKAAHILESCCQDLTYTGHLRLVASFAERIPREIIDRYPAVLLTWAWSLIRNLRFEDVRRLLAVARRRLAVLDNQGLLSREESTRLHYLLLHREMMLAAARDRPRQVEEQCRDLLDNYEEDIHPYLTGTNYAQLIYAQREQYRMDNVEELAARAQGILSRSGYSFGLINVQSIVGLSLFQAGRVESAIAALEDGLAEALRFSSESAELAALPGLPLSFICYERNELDRARELQGWLLSGVTVNGFVDQMLAGYITEARLKWLDSGEAPAFSALDEGLTIALDRGLERLRLGLVAERIRLLARHGNNAERMFRYGKSAGIPAAMDQVLPRASVTSVDDYRATAWARLAQSRGHLGDAIKVARQWRSFCDNRDAIPASVRWGVLLAQLQFVSGEPRLAQRTLRQALAAAAPLGLIRPFVDEGQVIATLLQNAFEGAPAGDHPTDIFAREVLALFQGRQPEAVSGREEPLAEGVFGSITPKEVEILSLISTGMSNREVAAKLGLTEGSIKWYMQQVFDKLGTRRRLQAVARARQLGLIK